MTFDLSGAVAIVALSWTIFQQYQISKLCEKCPFLPTNQEKEKKNLAS
jgi:hypothetical protein